MNASKTQAIKITTIKVGNLLIIKSRFFARDSPRERSSIVMACGTKKKIKLKISKIIETTIELNCIESKANAIKLLKSQLYEMELQKRREKQAEIEGSKKKIEWGSQIRSYTLHPYKLVKDVRTDFETSDAQGVLDGKLDGFIKSYLMEFGRKN